MSMFSSLVRLLHTGWFGRWRRRHMLAFGLILGTILGVVLTLTATFLAGTEDSQEQGELVILSAEDDSAGDQRHALVDQWNATHPQNHARIVELPRLADATYSQMVATAQSRKPDIDIYILDVTWTAEFAEAGYIRPLDESTIHRSEFLGNPIQTCVYKGKLWALPFNTNAGLLYYRTDLVKPPGSWAQMSRTAQDFLADPNRDPRVQAGYAGQLFRYEGLTVNGLEAIQAAAQNDMVRNGEVAIDLDDIQTGIDWLRPSTQGGIVLPDSLDYDEQRSMQAFRDGKVLFMRNWPVAYRDLTETIGDDGKPATSPVKFDVVPLPGKSVLGGENLAIAANSTKPKAAQALIEFLTDARSQQILFERGGFAATREIVYRDAEVRAKYKYADTLLQAIQLARPRPPTPCYRQFSEAFQTAVHQALRDAKPLPDDFADSMNAALKC
jgi:multiple sugar transport system substrate-binding protein